MNLYCESDNYKLYHGNMMDMLDVIEPNSITSIVTDPPYELNFLNKSWDRTGIAFNVETWKKCMSVLKPGGHLIAFCGSRTFHRMVCAIEDSGFEIRDVIMWIYGSGMPKSSNVGKMMEKKYDKEIIDPEMYKYGNALKPAYEPIVIARKPFTGSTIDNMMNNNVGAFNIDDCRIPSNNQDECEISKTGRFPSNVILTYDENDYDEVCSGFPQSGSGNNGTPYNYAGREYSNKDTSMFNGDKPQSPSNYNDSGSASRYFYCAKASRKDRDEGLEDFELVVRSDRNPELETANNQFNRSGVGRKNFHPTVKNTELMRYLVRLVTPKGGTILDPFNGSGSTGKATMHENFENNKDYKYIGIELDDEYLKISKSRIDYAKTHGLKEDNTLPKKTKTEPTDVETPQSLW